MPVTTLHLDAEKQRLFKKAMQATLAETKTSIVKKDAQLSSLTSHKEKLVKDREVVETTLHDLADEIEAVQDKIENIDTDLKKSRAYADGINDMLEEALPSKRQKTVQDS